MSLELILRRTGLILTSLVVAFFVLFVLGYAFDDPGGWTAVGLAALVVVPLAALTVVAVIRPALTSTVLVVALAVYALWAVVTLIWDPVELPTIPVIAVILALPIAVLGQREAMRAGVLMLVDAAVPLALVLVRLVTESETEGPGVRDLLGTSTGFVVVPLLILAAFFLSAGAVGRPAPKPGQRPVHPAPPAMTH